METGQILALMSKVMKEISHIGKDRKNPQQGYSFRGIDDVYNTLHGVLSANGVYFVPEVLEHAAVEGTTKSGTATINRTVKVRFTFYAPDGSSVQATTLGEGTDMSDKAANKAQSAAVKYCLIQVFCIPTQEMIDSEVDTPERPTDEMNDSEKFVAGLNDAFDAADFQAEERSAVIAKVCKAKKIPVITKLSLADRHAMLDAIVRGDFNHCKKKVTVGAA